MRRRLGVHRDRQRAAASAGVRRRRQALGWGWVDPPGGGRAKIENSSRRHPRKFGLKRFLAVRRSWRGNGWPVFGLPPLKKNLSAVAVRHHLFSWRSQHDTT